MLSGEYFGVGQQEEQSNVLVIGLYTSNYYTYLLILFAHPCSEITPWSYNSQLTWQADNWHAIRP